MLRSGPCQMWRCESMKPGMTIMLLRRSARAGRLQPGANGGDLRALDQHVGLLEVAERRVHRQDHAALEEQALARPAALEGAGRRRDRPTRSPPPPRRQPRRRTTRRPGCRDARDRRRYASTDARSPRCCSWLMSSPRPGWPSSAPCPGPGWSVGSARKPRAAADLAELARDLPPGLAARPLVT